MPLIVSGDPITEQSRPVGGHTNGNIVVHDAVETTQIAPTILELLGLNPNALQAVQIEHTPTLPLG